MDHNEALKAVLKVMYDQHQALTRDQVGRIRRVLVTLQRDSFQRGYDKSERLETARGHE